MLYFQNYLKFLKNYLLLLVPKFINKIIISNNQLYIYISFKYLREVLLFLRDNSYCLFKVLVDIIGVDYPTRVRRFEICYLLLSLTYNSRVILKINVNEEDLVPSIVSIYANANWYEREVWDLFGILFKYHPDLRRILTDYGFQGFPLRKDFPLSGYLEVNYDIAVEQVVYKPVKFIQEFRVYTYKNVWGYSNNSSFSPIIVKYNIYRNILYFSFKSYLMEL